MRISTETLQEKEHANVLQQDAFMLERRNMGAQPAFSPSKLIMLENLLDTVHSELQPSIQDYKAREDAVKFVNSLVRNRVSVGYIKERFGSCHVQAFGSFTMDMFTPSSDLDISLNMEYGVENLSREERIKILRRLTKCLYVLENGGGYVRDIQPVLKAKVPVVKFVYCKTGIECDISAENRDGMIKSDIIRILSSLDWRFRKLCFLVKAWANGHGINNSKDGTLNTLSIILLVAFHLQTRIPAILPPFSVFLEGSPSPATSNTISLVQERVRKFWNFGRENTESVVQLFKSLLLQLISVKDLWQGGLCASTYQGTWISTSKPSWIFVEDFTALTQNAARAVGEKGFHSIYECLHETNIHFDNYFRSLCDANAMKSLLFRPLANTSVKRGKRQLDDETVQTVENQRKLRKGVAAESHDVTQLMPEKSSIFSEIADWLAFEDKPRHKVIRHDDLVKNTHSLTSLPRASRAGQTTLEDTLQTTTVSKKLPGLQGEYPTKEFKSDGFSYDDRRMYIPTPSSPSAQQLDHGTISSTHRNLEPSFGNKLIHYETSGNSWLGDRQGRLVTAASPGGVQEAISRSRIHQQRPLQQYAVRDMYDVTANRPYSVSVKSPGLSIKASNLYDESMRAVYSSFYRNPVSSYASSEHKQYNRLYDSNLRLGLHYPQLYNEYAGQSTQYGTSRWI